MKKYSNILRAVLTGILILFFSFCVSSPNAGTEPKTSVKTDSKGTPNWFLDLNSGFPEKDFLAVIGEGDTRRDAESDAAGALSRIFMSDISVESTAMMRYAELSSPTKAESSTETSVEKTVNIGSNQSLFNIQYSDPYTDNVGRLHIVGYLDRKATARIYREKIDANSERVSSFLENMKKSDSIINKYAFIDAAVLFAKNNDVLMSQLVIVYEPMTKMLDLPYRTQDLIKLYTEIAAQMRFEIKIENDFDGKITKMVSFILNERGFSVAQGKGNLTISGDVELQDAQLNNKFENIRWYLALQMKDEKGSILVSFNKNQRESAVSRPEAIAGSYRQMEKMVKAEFIGQFIKYLDGIILK
ncbi:MAG: hypothetical protein JW904_11605 [Spirochaetales bacterium]|nr:hypothetical protein [Spirochaetales bacterium]